jgi:hypothetical protein
LSSGPGPDDRAPAGTTDPAGPGPAGPDPAGPDPAGTGGSANRVLAALKKPPMPSSALEISLGTIQTLFASPWAICGSICMYW